jgi:hypothetical protein
VNWIVAEVLLQHFRRLESSWRAEPDLLPLSYNDRKKLQRQPAKIFRPASRWSVYEQRVFRLQRIDLAAAAIVAPFEVA